MLTAEQVRALAEEGETFEVEFKEEPLNDAGLVEAVMCLANGNGGVVLVGVADDGTVLGAAPRHGKSTDVWRVTGLLANSTVPSVRCDASVVLLDGKEVLAVEVAASHVPVSTRAGLFKRRAIGGDGKPACVPYHFYEMAIGQASLGQLDPTARFVEGIGWDDLDRVEFARLRDTLERQRGRADASLFGLSDAEIVRALALGTGGGATVERLTLAAVLLLGRESVLRQVAPTHEAAFQVLDGSDVRVNDFMRWPLIRLADALFERFEALNIATEVKDRHLRRLVPHHDPDGVREAILNALVHRDYQQRGALHVQLRDPWLHVSSPGGFVAGVRLDNLLVVTPQPRNPLLADAFKRLGLVERTGRGVDAIFEGQLLYGRPVPDYTASTERVVEVRLKGGAPDMRFAQWLSDRQVPGKRTPLEHLLLFDLAYRMPAVSVSAAMHALQRPEPETRAILADLVAQGRFETADNQAFRFAATERAQLALRADTPLPLASEDAVMNHVRTHRRITRAEAAELLQIPSPAARSVLSALVASGQLELVPNRRWSYYRLPGAQGQTIDLWDPL